MAFKFFWLSLASFFRRCLGHTILAVPLSSWCFEHWRYVTILVVRPWTQFTVDHFTVRRRSVATTNDALTIASRLVFTFITIPKRVKLIFSQKISLSHRIVYMFNAGNPKIPEGKQQNCQKFVQKYLNILEKISKNDTNQSPSGILSILGLKQYV